MTVFYSVKEEEFGAGIFAITDILEVSMRPSRQRCLHHTVGSPLLIVYRRWLGISVRNVANAAIALPGSHLPRTIDVWSSRSHYAIPACELIIAHTRIPNLFLGTIKHVAWTGYGKVHRLI